MLFSSLSYLKLLQKNRRSQSRPVAVNTATAKKQMKILNNQLILLFLFYIFNYLK